VVVRADEEKLSTSVRETFMCQVVRLVADLFHSLIMLLVFSDFFKSAWQLIYPAVVLTRGSVTSQSRFCQASGFLLAMGIEASGRAPAARTF
jgi:hypothetical protein